MTDWRDDVIPKVIELLHGYSYKPTVRGMFYRLVLEEILPNTFKVYKGLIQALSTARSKTPGEPNWKFQLFRYRDRYSYNSTPLLNNSTHNPHHHSLSS